MKLYQGDEPLNLENQIAKLSSALQAIQTLGEIHALIVDYTYEEIEQVFEQLAPEQQAQIKAICDRDTQKQLAIEQVRSNHFSGYFQGATSAP
ncbi:MAG TPA: hypothetical protein DDZ80_18025 [Cyanobacteria bacterium UBA8803]|nr:hypothetical protein [Cyanobacteria bacterium UBA8803]